jgi:hypothetical protein
LYNIAYGTDINYVRNISDPGALEQWLLADGRIPFHNEFLTEVTLDQWRTIMLAQGGTEGSFKWYRAMMRGYNTADEQGEWIRAFLNLFSRSSVFLAHFLSLSRLLLSLLAGFTNSH